MKEVNRKQCSLVPSSLCSSETKQSHEISEENVLALAPIMKVTIVVISLFSSRLSLLTVMEMWVGSTQFSRHTVRSVMHLYPSFLKDTKGKVVMPKLNKCVFFSGEYRCIGVFSMLFKTRGQCPPAHTVPAHFFFFSNYG